MAAAHRSIGGGGPRHRGGRAPSNPQRALFSSALPERFSARLSFVSARRVSTRGFRQAQSRAWASVSQALGCEATAQIRRPRRPRIDWQPRVRAVYPDTDGGLARHNIWGGAARVWLASDDSSTRVDSGRSRDDPNPPSRCRNVTSATARHLIIPTCDRHGLSTVARGAVQTSPCVQPAEDAKRPDNHGAASRV